MTSPLWGPPSNLRLVVIDLETVVGPDGHHRIVALGVVVCRGRIGSLGQQASWLVNPDCAVDEETRKRHGLTNDHLADQPMFDEVWPLVAPLLTGKPGETVVLAAHYTPFDIPTLRREIARIGSSTPLPDLPLLDTWGRILEIAGLTALPNKQLPTVLAALGLTNAKHHDALADATATAEAARVLLERAEAAGHTDLPALLAALGTGSTGTVRAGSKPGIRRQVLVALPEDHLARHVAIFPASPSAVDLADWASFVAECASLRCDGLAGQAANVPPGVLRPMLFAALAGTTDPAAVATILGALVPLLDPLPDAIDAMRAEVPGLVRHAGKGGARGVALALYTHLDAVLAGLPRCPTERPCPSCRDGLPCPRDVWAAALVASVFAGTETSATTLWNVRGLAATPQSKAAGRSYLSLQQAAPALADFAIRAAHAFWRENGDPGTAASLADQVWREAGCRDPGITEARALLTAAPGRSTDLAAAIADCEAVLAANRGCTDAAVTSLAVTTEMLSGRLSRLDNPTVRRHHPANPVRPARPARFLRAVR